MPQYTVEAFRWTGTGYNATYNTSYTATFDDDDANYQGAADANESVSIDGGGFVPTTGQPYVITINFTDVNGDPHTEEFNFFNASGGGGWYFVPEPGSAFTVGATLGNYQSHYNGWTYSSVVCFAAGTRIATPRGARRVEDLRPGDLVLSPDGRDLVLRQIMTRNLTARETDRFERLRPVCISAGALGPGVPHRDLRLSRQHRVMLRSVVAERMFGQREVLVPAIRLTALPGVFVEPAPGAVSYVHLVFETHEIVLAEGVASESFFPGREALQSLPPEARAEIETLFPQLCDGALPDYARCVPPPARQKRLISRLMANGKSAIEPACAM